jgi:hypothetical protein
MIVMPLDAKRFGWSPDFPIWLKSLGGTALCQLASCFIDHLPTTHFYHPWSESKPNENSRSFPQAFMGL